MSPVKEQYQEFKLKHGLMKDVDADISLSPERNRQRQKFRDLQDMSAKRGVPMDQPDVEWERVTRSGA